MTCLCVSQDQQKRSKFIRSKTSTELRRILLIFLKNLICKMASNDTVNHVESEKTEEEVAKQKMTARYNLFRYKSKDISSMTYNGELSYQIFFSLQKSTFIDTFLLYSCQLCQNCHFFKRIVLALKMWKTGLGWRNLVWPLIYSIVRKGIKKTQIKSMETTKTLF